MTRYIERAVALTCLVFTIGLLGTFAHLSMTEAEAAPTPFKTSAIVKDCNAHRRSISWADNGDVVLVLGVKCPDMRFGEAMHTFVLTGDKHRVLDGNTRQDIGAAPGEFFTQAAVLAATLDKQVIKVLCAAGKCEP